MTYLAAINWPAINVYWIPPGTDAFLIATWTPAGTVTVTSKPVLLIYPGSGAGAYDTVVPMPCPRVTRWDLVWTLPGGASVTYNSDFAFQM